MKKLVLFFVVLITLVVIAGCNNSRRAHNDPNVTVTEADNGTKVTITTINKNEDGADPEEEAVLAVNDTITDETSDSNENELPDQPFKITSSDSSQIYSDKGYHLIEGSTPKSTDRIVVNDYTLSKYQPGEPNWRYIAAVSLGTLKKGSNKFTISAFDADNNQLGSETIDIVYQGEENGELAPTGSSLTWILVLSALSGMMIVYRKPKIQ